MARLFANLSFQSKNSRNRLSRVCGDDGAAPRAARRLVDARIFGGRLRVPTSLCPRAFKSAAQAGPVTDITAMIATAAGPSGSLTMASVSSIGCAAAAVTKRAHAIVKSLHFGFANEPWHYRGQVAAKLANYLSPPTTSKRFDYRHEVVMSGILQ